MASELGSNNVYVSTDKVSLIQRLREIFNYRTLLWTLAWRDIRVRYKHSILGIAWAMFIPISMMLLFSFVFTKVVVVKTDVPYIIYVYCGILPWQFFSSATTSAANSLLANRALVTKIYFPAEVFPFSSVIAAFVDLMVGSIILVALMVYFSFTGSSINVSWTAILVVAVIFIQVLFTAGMSLFLAMSNLFFRDVRYVYSVLISLWMFASSVIYPMKVSNASIQRILNLNPMSPILEAYRDVLIRGKLIDISTFGYSAVVSIAIFFFGWIIFFKMQYRFAEKA